MRMVCTENISVLLLLRNNDRKSPFLWMCPIPPHPPRQKTKIEPFISKKFSSLTDLSSIFLLSIQNPTKSSTHFRPFRVFYPNPRPSSPLNHRQKIHMAEVLGKHGADILLIEYMLIYRSAFRSDHYNLLSPRTPSPSFNDISRRNFSVPGQWFLSLPNPA